MTKLTIPPVGSGLIGGGRYQDSTYSDGYLAGINAIIALLREPDILRIEALLSVQDTCCASPPCDLTSAGCTCYLTARATIRALADELERRKP